MSSWPRRCSCVSPSRVDETHAAEGSWDAVGLAERADAVAEAEVGADVAGEEGPDADGAPDDEGTGAGGVEEQPARASATTPEVVTAIRRRARCRVVGKVTERRYVIDGATSECRHPP